MSEQNNASLRNTAIFFVGSVITFMLWGGLHNFPLIIPLLMVAVTVIEFFKYLKDTNLTV